MARKKAPPPESDGDVPMWFMTYSDVITLMMTFFILLLTFATSEPERFEQMQISLFGVSGANGLVGERPDGPEKDSWLMRVRPRSARLTDEGNEMPPVERDTVNEAVADGLSGLEDDEQSQIVDTVAFEVSGRSIGAPGGELYDYGVHYLKVISKIMQNRPYELTIEISSPGQLERAVSCVGYLYHVQLIRPDRLILGRDEFDGLSSENIRFRLQYFKGKSDGETRTQAAQ